VAALTTLASKAITVGFTVRSTVRFAAK